VSCIVKDEPEHKTHNELIAGTLVLGLSSDRIGIIRGAGSVGAHKLPLWPWFPHRLETDHLSRLADSYIWVFFLASLAMFVLTKVRGVSENRIKGRQIGAFCCCCCCYCSIILLSAGQQQEAAICIQFWHLPLSYPRLPVWLLKFWCGA